MVFALFRVVWVHETQTKMGLDEETSFFSCSLHGFGVSGLGIATPWDTLNGFQHGLELLVGHGQSLIHSLEYS